MRRLFAVLAGVNLHLLFIQFDTVLLEHRHIALLIDRSRIEQRGLDLVSELLIEGTEPIGAALLLPVQPLIALMRPLDDARALSCHHSVIDLGDLEMQMVTPKRFTCFVVVIDHGDVVMRMTAHTVDMRDDQDV